MAAVFGLFVRIYPFYIVAYDVMYALRSVVDVVMVVNDVWKISFFAIEESAVGLLDYVYEVLKLIPACARICKF